MAMQDIVKIHENDNVAVALRPLAKGETLDVAGAKVSLFRGHTPGTQVCLKVHKSRRGSGKVRLQDWICKGGHWRRGRGSHVHNVRTALAMCPYL